MNLNYWLYLEQYARVIIQTKFLKIFYSKSGQISRFAQISHSTSVCTGNTIRQIILAEMASQTFHFSKIKNLTRSRTHMAMTWLIWNWPRPVIRKWMVYWIRKGWIFPHSAFFTCVNFTITPHIRISTIITTPSQIPCALGCDIVILVPVHQLCIFRRIISTLEQGNPFSCVFF